MDNFVKIEFFSKGENQAFARVCASAFAAQLDPTLEEISDIKTAVSEAVTNAIIHGYEGGEGKVTLSMKREGRTLTYIVSDKGCGIENIEQAMTPLYTSKPDFERSGMGFTVMESFMDSLFVASKPQSGTIVTMTKNIL